MARKPPAKDWDRYQVTAALKRAGISFAGLARAHNLHHTSVRTALYQSSPRCEALIAAALGVRPESIWPSRYTADAVAANPWRRHALARLGHPAADLAGGSSEPISKHETVFGSLHCTELAEGYNGSARVAA
ncbi:MAG: helix-turn-helix domain-containing protein [Aromatoleum sp.]|jgi:Ner family transcriptional regulator|uniref:helix-turn-helix domain-containing protein n=1 Tax=Aromatoleum sp. TaxID=2307007 RepID=UPI002895538C|nr:helix-turn-helix domain-containing protein [Aromatoleum sp.]MDT3671811.1 helix-turn-helix domain-containing protein [Aromatoleum sp.]